MIRRLVDQAFNSGKYYISAVGLSTDVKPTEGIITGSKFVEVDTGIGYLFDETSGEWHKNQQLSAAVQAYFEDHPEAIDQAAIEAMFGDQLDGIEEDIGGLKSAVHSIVDFIDLDSDDCTVWDGYCDLDAMKLVSASYTRLVYTPINGSVAQKVTVFKSVGKLFRIAFSVNPPGHNVSLINESGCYIDAGEKAYATVNVPNTANYVIATIWNQNTDSNIPASDMIDSVSISIDNGAKDVKARADIAELNNEIEHIPPETIDTITRTGANYINEAIINEEGQYWNGSTIGNPITLSPNATYNAIKIRVEPAVYDFYPVRYVHALDADNRLLQVVTTDQTTSFDNTNLGARFLCFTFYAYGFSNAYVCKHGQVPFDQYTVSKQWVFQDLRTSENFDDVFHLPSKIYCGVGRTIELYNEQVFLNENKYHINWECDTGVAYKRKFSVTGTNDNIGSHSLIFRVYDDNYKLVISKTATLIISANSIGSALKVLPIGDSLTNGKDWLSEVPTLSDSKIEFIGTRTLSGRASEGRSGATTGWYVTNSTYTYADGSTYTGNPNVLGSSNPFWDGAKFSLNHYITQQASYVGTPDAVQIMLGTNDLKQTATVVANIKTMVDAIHTEYPTMPVFVCNPIFHSNQNGYYSTGGEGYVGVMSNWQYELDRYTIVLMSALAEVFDTSTYNSFVTIVPVATCMDREYDFGQVVVPVNPRLSTVTETIPSQYTHPQSAGYLQMADAMFSVYCAKLN